MAPPQKVVQQDKGKETLIDPSDGDRIRWVLEQVEGAVANASSLVLELGDMKK